MKRNRCFETHILKLCSEKLIIDLTSTNKNLKMKSLLVLLFLITQFAYGQKSDKSFVLIGRIANADTLQKAILFNTTGCGKPDTVCIIDGHFVFTGHVDYPCLGLVNADQFQGGIGVWLSNDTIRADFKLEKRANGTIVFQTDQVNGPQDAMDYLHHLKTFLPFYLQKQNQRISDEIRNYVTSHRDSYYSVHLISTYRNEIGASTAKELLALISPQAKESREAQALELRIKTLDKNTLGKPIADFKLPDTTSKPRKLSALLKPYTLIHFWASWCKPCREHSPELVALYQKTDPEKLRMIGVSLDENRLAWLKAIRKDNFQWIQLSDLEGNKSPIIKELAISSIPYVMLIDQDYKILANTLDEATKLINK